MKIGNQEVNTSSISNNNNVSVLSASLNMSNNSYVAPPPPVEPVVFQGKVWYG